MCAASAPRSNLVAAATALVLASCAVGPNFHAPQPPATQGYLHAPSSQPGKTDAQDVQRLNPGAEVAGDWWQLFHSPALDEVVRAAIAGSPTLAAADATLAQAREQVIVARAALLPGLSGNAGVQRSGVHQGSLGPASPAAPSGASTSGLYSMGLSASYSLDLFGGIRRNIEQQAALAEYQRYQLAAAYLTLTGDVVDEALTIASTRLQIATTKDLIESDRKNLALTQREFDVGVATRADVLTADSQLASDLTQLPTLQRQLEQAYDALTVLVGRAPAEWKSHDFDIKELTLPREVPLSLPARLVRQRPDVLAAQAQLHASSAAIGVAIAQEFPSLNLSGSITRQALEAGGLFHQFDTLWNAGGAFAVPIFEGGAQRAEVRAARDAFKAEAATYRSVVLEALGQVADDLWALQYDAQVLTVDRHSVDVASEALKLQRKSYAVGTTTVLNLIAAERAYAQARLSYATAQIQQFEDTAGLLVALGGGWWEARIGPPGQAPPAVR
ncbi:MAG TPA: efflux transporter outer membrane subunit [Steroidobacteraceae bacterium]|nr:efflux transporter outer membrane subunit [Steroidobacteraceae bacterium]